MRAKFRIVDVDQTGDIENLLLEAVTDGTPEDNTYSKWTPFAKLNIAISNPALAGKFAVGEKYYADFTLAEGAALTDKDFSEEDTSEEESTVETDGKPFDGDETSGMSDDESAE